jgi:uncharacterized protein YecT (DUF1311 family)
LDTAADLFSLGETSFAQPRHIYGGGKMKILRLFAASAVLLTTVMPFNSIQGQDPNFKPPGTEENAAVDAANAQLDVVYKQLLSKLDPEVQPVLKEAERAWIKWRDSEAMLIARAGGAIGGSALRVDYASAQAKLIKERVAALKECMKLAESNR